MKTKFFIFLFLTGSVIPNLLFAQFMQEGPKLSGTGGVASSQLGESVSLSADGNTAILGGADDNVGIGAAWIFIRSGGVWTQQGPKLVGTGYVGNPLQGASVSISADGNTAAIGGYGDNSSVGAIWIFTRSSGVWTQQGPKLVGTGNSVSAEGNSVSLSGDGNTVIVGGPYDSSSKGCAWVFTRTSGVWTQQGQKLLGAGAYGFSSFGGSVSMSADGNTAVIGGASDINGIYQVGATWIFVRSGNVWIQQGPKLVGTGYVGHCFQGTSVSISSNGNTVITGGRYDNDLMGAAWIFTRSNGAWTQQGTKLVGAGSVGGNIWQGGSVSISGDGNTAVIGGWGDNPNGAAWVFIRIDTIWYQLGSKLVGTGAIGNANQGMAVAISNNGTTVIVGGYVDNNNAGAAWVFVRSSFRLINSRHNLHKIIPGNQTTYDTSTITTNIFSYFTSNVMVTIDSLRYMNLSDLELTLTHLTNTETSTTYTDTLIYQVGGAGTNFIGTVLTDSASTPIANGTAPFTGSFKPTRPLSLFHNLDPSGIWILSVYDRITGRSGTLDAWTLTIDIVPSLIFVHPISHQVPKGFRLMQNYPNPFNPTTKINFDISKSAFASIKIYDILGREVETLVNQQLKPGTYEADFDGSKFTSGIYFYVMKTESFSETRKMVLIK
jgi:hypothetical protein